MASKTSNPVFCPPIRREFVESLIPYQVVDEQGLVILGIVSVASTRGSLKSSIDALVLPLI